MDSRTKRDGRRLCRWCGAVSRPDTSCAALLGEGHLVLRPEAVSMAAKTWLRPPLPLSAAHNTKTKTYEVSIPSLFSTCWTERLLQSIACPSCRTAWQPAVNQDQPSITTLPAPNIQAKRCCFQEMLALGNRSVSAMEQHHTAHHYGTSWAKSALQGLIRPADHSKRHRLLSCSE
jgi:hypothetical protein